MKVSGADARTRRKPAGTRPGIDITAKVAGKARKFAGRLGPLGKLAGLAELAILRAAIVGTTFAGIRPARRRARAHLRGATDALAKRMGNALAAEGLDWKQMQFTLERHLPALSVQNFNQGKEERLFPKAQRGAHAQDFERSRLASSSHSRLRVTLVEPADSVTDMEVAELLQAADGGMNDVAALFLRLSKKRGDAWATKGERLLDQFGSFDEEIKSAVGCGCYRGNSGRKRLSRFWEP